MPGGIDIDNVSINSIHIIRDSNGVNNAHLECKKDDLEFVIDLNKVEQALFIDFCECQNVMISIENADDSLVLLVK